MWRKSMYLKDMTDPIMYRKVDKGNQTEREREREKLWASRKTRHGFFKKKTMGMEIKQKKITYKLERAIRF